MCPIFYGCSILEGKDGKGFDGTRWWWRWRRESRHNGFKLWGAALALHDHHVSLLYPWSYLLVGMVVRLLLHLARKKGRTQEIVEIVVIVFLFVVEMVVVEVVGMVAVAVVVGVVAVVVEVVVEVADDKKN